VNNALDGQGHFSPERAGSLPSGALVRMAYSGEYDLEQIMKKLVGGVRPRRAPRNQRSSRGREDDGFRQRSREAHLRGARIPRRKGEIGACRGVALRPRGRLALTGGLAYSARLVQYISAKVAFIARVLVYPERTR
jgi:butyrate kinase